jgi:hypothetical protein
MLLTVSSGVRHYSARHNAVTARHRPIYIASVTCSVVDDGTAGVEGDTETMCTKD